MGFRRILIERNGEQRIVAYMDWKREYRQDGWVQIPWQDPDEGDHRGGGGPWWDRPPEPEPAPRPLAGAGV